MKFLEKYNHPKNSRFNSFKKAFEICLERDLKVIVETGTARGKKKYFFFNYHNWKDGMSTLMFADYAHSFNGELHTCDISLENINNSKNYTKKFIQNVRYHHQDSLDFLKNFKKKIDFLYLDSLDGHDPKAASIHQLKEIEIGQTKLHNKSIVLLDDKGSKTNLSIEYLINLNYKIIYETEYQVLLSEK